MILTEYTRVGNGIVKRSETDAAMLSMLPYGVAKKEALWLFFSSNPSATKMLARSIAMGYIAEGHIKATTKRYDYSQTYYMLTVAGLAYLADKYDQNYPWLHDAVQRIEKSEVPSFSSGIKANSLKSILTAHSCDVVFNISGAETIFDRLRYEPQKALAALSAQTESLSFCTTWHHSMQKAIERWVSAEKSGDAGNLVKLNQINKTINGGAPQYYDLIELKVGEGTAYRNECSSPKDTAAKSIAERKERMLNHCGLLKTNNHIYVIYQAVRDGIAWNSSLLAAKKYVLANEASRLGLIENVTKAPSTYPSIILVEGKGEKIAAFRSLYFDTYGKRKGKDKMLGRGTFALHAIPVTREAISFLGQLTAENGFANFNVEWVNTLANSMPDTFKRTSINRDNLLTYNGIQCFFGMDMDFHQLNHCYYCEQDIKEASGQEEYLEPAYAMEGLEYAVVCYQWQAKYIRSIAPNAKIVYIDFNTRSAVEYVE